MFFFLFLQYPLETYGYALLFSLCGYLGIQMVLTLVQCCGAFAAATITTFRKAVTIIISFIFFYKPFTFQYVWSGLLVVLGIYLNIYSKKHTGSPVGLKQLWIGLKNYCKRQDRIQRQLLTSV